MWKYPKKFDVIVVGAGHAGCEAAYVSAKKGLKTLLITINLDTIAKLSCNPSIGGTAKGHIVREIDALGGLMGKVADKSAIHYRLLNASKGAAVKAPRAQVDRVFYQYEMKKILENTKNLEIKQHVAKEIVVKKDVIKGIVTEENIFFESFTVIITTGTFLKSKIHIGRDSTVGGRIGDISSENLSKSLVTNGLKLGRFKTGTPPRIHKRSIDFSKTDIQPSDKNVRFSHRLIGDNLEDDNLKDENLLKESKLATVDCFITYTTPYTHEIINKNLDKSALFSGKISGIGPRYCPSIEDKVTRFKDKPRHQVFLEPEGINTNEYYINGMSTSLSFDVQYEFIRSIIGIEKAEIMRPAYAIEYDFVLSEQIKNTFETKKIKNLFLAGQINGTTGYEEAAAQGLVAGINAANNVLEKAPFTIDRSIAYIGVMIDDLISQTLLEPYRMFTSRAEHRLYLRQDNADLRLYKLAYSENIISQQSYLKIKKKDEIISQELLKLQKIFKNVNGKKVSLFQILSRPDFTYEKLYKNYSSDINKFDEDIQFQIEVSTKYSGYIERQKNEIEKLKYLKSIKIPTDFPYTKVIGLRKEALEKLLKFTPPNLSIAQKLGVSPADLSILMVALQKKLK